MNTLPFSYKLQAEKLKITTDDSQPENLGAFRDMPSELVVKIFEQLDANSLISACVVCRRFNLIGPSVLKFKPVQFDHPPSYNYSYSGGGNGGGKEPDLQKLLWGNFSNVDNDINYYLPEDHLEFVRKLANKGPSTIDISKFINRDLLENKLEPLNLESLVLQNPSMDFSPNIDLSLFIKQEPLWKRFINTCQATISQVAAKANQAFQGMFRF